MPALLLWDQIQHSSSLQEPLYLAFVDLTAAYDSVDRTKLWEVLLQIGIPPLLVRCLQGLYYQNEGHLDGQEWTRNLERHNRDVLRSGGRGP